MTLSYMFLEEFEKICISSIHWFVVAVLVVEILSVRSLRSLVFSDLQIQQTYVVNHTQSNSAILSQSVTSHPRFGPPFRPPGPTTDPAHRSLVGAREVLALPRLAAPELLHGAQGPFLRRGAWARPGTWGPGAPTKHQ